MYQKYKADPDLHLKASDYLPDVSYCLSVYFDIFLLKFADNLNLFK